MEVNQILKLIRSKFENKSKLKIERLEATVKKQNDFIILKQQRINKLERCMDQLERDRAELLELNNQLLELNKTLLARTQTSLN